MSQLAFKEQVLARLSKLRPAEQRVMTFVIENREEALMGSASSLAEKAGTSDATVIRAVKALGFTGMEALRRALADDMRADLSPSNRLARTLSEVGDDLTSAFEVTLDTHQKSLERLRTDISPEQFKKTVDYIISAQRTHIFGIGPSSAMASYFSAQLARFGFAAASLAQTGLLLADQLLGIQKGDVLLMFAYGRIYPELATLLRRAKTQNIPVILFSDSLGPQLGGQVDVSLAVPRGTADMLSMHTATLGLIEALLVGIAKAQPQKTLASLELLNELRADLVGQRMDIPTS